MTIYGMLHRCEDVQRLYLPRGQGGRGLKSVEDCVRLEEAGLADVQSSTRPLMVAVAKEGLALKEKTLTQKQLKEQKELERAEGWKDKPLYGQVLRQTEEIRDDATWDWLRKGDLQTKPAFLVNVASPSSISLSNNNNNNNNNDINNNNKSNNNNNNNNLKKETEEMITAAQDQALRTNAIKAKVEKQNLCPLCRMCGEKDDSVGHLVGVCSKLAQAEYKHPHDNVARMIHWNITHSYGLDVSSKWYEHKPEEVIENDHVKLLWDLNIQTSTYIQARRPGVVVVDREKKTCNIIDIAVPVDAGREKRREEESWKVPRSTKRGGTTLECQSCYCGWCARRRHTQPF